MKLIPLLLAALLFTGCAAQNSPPDAGPSAAMEEAPRESTLLLSSQTENGLTVASLGQSPRQLLSLGDRLLVETAEALWLLEPDTLAVTAIYEWEAPISQDVLLQRLDTGVAFFCPDTGETVVLDSQLRERCRIPAPEGLTGAPLLSSDGGTLFYCASDALRALDRATGISRILKEMAYPGQALTAVLLEDSLLQLRISDPSGQERTLFLSADTGQLLREAAGDLPLQAVEDTYLLQDTREGIPLLLLGCSQGEPQLLNPSQTDPCCFLLSRSRIFSWAADSLALYDPQTGLRTAAAPLSGGSVPRLAVQTGDGLIFWLTAGEDTLFRWDPAAFPVSDAACYTAPYYTRQNPDYDGLAACTLYAQRLSEQYGITIRVYREAATTAPWDYDLEAEYRADLLLAELEALEQRLSALPAGFLDTLAGSFTGLNLSLVRSITASPESGREGSVEGLQFLVDFEAYIVLAASADTEYAFYHELCHLMETVILSGSTAYDRWDSLNPPDFQYDPDHRLRDSSQWLQPGGAYFIDSYSTSAPREDRARLFEYAMTPGHGELFSSPPLQQKLRQLCIGIREAFGLKKTEAALPWEQYLLQSLS